LSNIYQHIIRPQAGPDGLDENRFVVYLELMIKKYFFIPVMAALVLAGCYSHPESPLEEASLGEKIEVFDDIPGGLELPPPWADLPVSLFKEVWAYLVAGQEQALTATYPLSDVGYFGAEIDSYGQLVDVPNPKKVSFYRGRLHLVVGCSGRALTHFALAEGSRERKQLVEDLLAAAKPYDGLQIDFENVPAKDGDAFISFLTELRTGLKEKIFTIALPARTRTLSSDVYDYRKIKNIVDRILVMAYDEHWSTSEPGPIASMDWCSRVASYSLETIGTEKLIMGLPFYGRSWGDLNPNRAFLFSGIERIIREQNIEDIQRENGIPTFKYEAPLSVTVYYEDDYSLSARLEMYKRMGVEAVGFWRLGQETPAVWDLIGLDTNQRD
jgi:hypothetical protein